MPVSKLVRRAEYCPYKAFLGKHRGYLGPIVFAIVTLLAGI